MCFYGVMAIGYNSILCLCAIKWLCRHVISCTELLTFLGSLNGGGVVGHCVLKWVLHVQQTYITQKSDLTVIYYSLWNTILSIDTMCSCKHIPFVDQWTPTNIAINYSIIIWVITKKGHMRKSTKLCLWTTNNVVNCQSKSTLTFISTGLPFAWVRCLEFETKSLLDS